MILQRLCRRHDRQGFSCGDEALDQYFRERASVDVKYHDASCYVLTKDAISAEVIGFFTLTQTSSDRALFPSLFGGYGMVPLTLLGRLGVSVVWQGQGIGSLLLAKAVEMAGALAEVAASRGLVVQAKDERVQQFYLKAGFKLMNAEERKLVYLFKRRNNLPKEAEELGSLF